MNILHYLKYLLFSSYRYDFNKLMDEKKLRQRMAEHPENFTEDAYYINEKIVNDDGHVIMILGRLKVGWPPAVDEKAKNFYKYLDGEDTEKAY